MMRRWGPLPSRAWMSKPDPGVDDGAPRDDLTVVGVDDEGAADDIAAPPGERGAVAAPAQVQAHHDDLAVMSMLGPLRVFPHQQQVIGLHEPVDSLVIDRREPPISSHRATGCVNGSSAPP